MSADSPAAGRLHRWRFFRSGGFDQVRLDTGADLRNLRDLDQKLWVALSCPTRGVEFDTRTLDLIDTDQDGRIRAPELLDAVDWACGRVRDADLFTTPGPDLPLAAINDADEPGRQLLDAARRVLSEVGRPAAEAIELADLGDIGALFAASRFNGDGVIPPSAAEDEDTRQAIADIAACTGGVPDRSGETGVDEATVELFFADAGQLLAWWDACEHPDIRVLGEQTPEAAAALDVLRERVDDYFTRCRLVAYDPRAAEALNAGLDAYLALAARPLTADDPAIAALPLARIGASAGLALKDGLNPAWSEAVERFRQQVVVPLLGEREHLTREEWEALCRRLDRYRAWSASKPSTCVEPLGVARLKVLAQGSARAAIEGLIARDRELTPGVNAAGALEKLIRLRRDLHPLLNNFVSFRDFYATTGMAMFQVGRLYLDGRSCDLCLPVADVERHAALATLSRACLVYCHCRRRGGDETMTIMAAVTDGDSDQLREGRNGVFYDRSGRDWDATVVRIVENPISLRQAFWAPYKRLGRLVSEQIEKFASARSAAVDEQLAAGVDSTAARATGGAPAGTQAFDIAKFAGIFAALGLALGAIGTAIASIVTGLLELAWWQFPVVAVGLMLAISGPSVLLAWMKLRQRNLAPILDANGWAVNARALLSIPFGTTLTRVAHLPEGSERALRDPYAARRQPWGLYLLLAALVALLVTLWRQGVIAAWFGAIGAP